MTVQISHDVISPEAFADVELRRVKSCCAVLSSAQAALTRQQGHLNVFRNRTGWNEQENYHRALVAEYTTEVAEAEAHLRQALADIVEAHRDER